MEITKLTKGLSIDVPMYNEFQFTALEGTEAQLLCNFHTPVFEKYLSKMTDSTHAISDSGIIGVDKYAITSITSSTKIAYSVDDLAFSTLCTKINSNCNNITGSIESLFRLTSLTEFKGGALNVVGEVRTLANKMFQYGRTSGELAITGNGKITLDGVAFSGIKTITFTPSGATIE